MKRKSLFNPTGVAVGNTAERLPKLSGVRNGLKGIESLLIAPQNQANLNVDPDKPITPATGYASGVIDRLMTNRMDADNIAQLLPDLELAKQILVSSIISPNDMISCELGYHLNGDELGELGGKMLKTVQEYFDDDYKIRDYLTTMLERALFDSGSYPILIIPESSLDDAINSNARLSSEALQEDIDLKTGHMKNYGILGASNPTANTKTKSTLSHLGVNLTAESLSSYIQEVNAAPANVNDVLKLTITDNPNALKLPLVWQKNAQRRVDDIYGMKMLSVESIVADHTQTDNGKANSTTKHKTSTAYQQRQFKHMPVLQLKTLSELDKPTNGHPLVLHLPSESVIPVHLPSDPEHHIGYFIATDRSGNPVSLTQSDDLYGDLAARNSTFANIASQLASTARRGQEGFTGKVHNAEEMVRMYTEVVEKELNASLANGVYGENAKVATPSHIYEIMFSRLCAGLNTQLVYAPASLMTYLAFEYNRDGTGKSLIEKTKIISTLRALLTFSSTMGAVGNSISHKTLNIQLDPDDPNPAQTVEQMIDAYTRVRLTSFPIAASSPSDIITYLQNAGIDIAVSGNAAYPETKMSVDERTSNYVKPDTDLAEDFQKKHHMSFGLSPEAVDQSVGANFAVSVVSSNILHAKRAMLSQDILCEAIGDHIRKFTTNSSVLMDRLVKLVTDNRALTAKGGVSDKYSDIDLVMHFINNVNVSLPRPDLKQLDMQTEAFATYSKALDEVLPAFINTEMFVDANLGNATQGVDIVTKVWKSYLQRKWLKSNNIMPEVFDLQDFGEGDAGFNMLEEHNQYLQTIKKTITDYVVAAAKSVAVTNERIEKAGQTDGGGDFDSGSTDTSDTGGDTDDDLGLGDGFGDPTDDGEGGGDGDPESTDDEDPFKF